MSDSPDRSGRITPEIPVTLNKGKAKAQDGVSPSKCAEMISEALSDNEEGGSDGMEVDALLGQNAERRGESPEVDDITEAMGTQKLKISSERDETTPSSRAMSPSPELFLPLPGATVPAVDKMDDFYASENEEEIPAPRPRAPSSEPSSSGGFITHSEFSATPPRTPDDNDALLGPLLPATRSVGATSRSSNKNTYGGVAALDFDTYRRNYTIRVKYTSELESTLHDWINSFSDTFRMSKDLRKVLTAAIAFNTLHDEPRAPPIEIKNDIDDEPTPAWEFFYTNELYHGPGVPPPQREGLVACDCVGKCDPRSRTCACAVNQRAVIAGGVVPVNELGKYGFMYDKSGRLKEYGPAIHECNDLCRCDQDCPNRVSGSLFYAGRAVLIYQDRSSSMAGRCHW